MKLSPSDDPRIRILSSHLGDPILGGNQEVRFNSPFQHRFPDPSKSDTSGHLYVNSKKGKFYCYKSGLCGSISYLFYLLGEARDSDPIRVAPIDQLRERLKNLDKMQQFVLPVAELPEWYNFVIRGSVVHKYLIGRGLTDDDIAWYKIGEGFVDDDWKVIIPSFGLTGECEYWVARTADPENKFRYKNPSVNRRYHVGFLYSALKVTRHIVLCEGVFSAIVAGRDAVATYGKFVTNDQLNRIWNAGIREITLALDGDAMRESVDTAERAIAIGFQTSIVELPLDEDPADMGRDRFRQLLQKAYKVSDTKLLRIRLRKI